MHHLTPGHTKGCTTWSMAAQLRRPAELRKSDLEIAKKPAGHGSVGGDGGGPQGQGESLDVSFQDLLQAGGGLAHETSGGVKRVRWATARAYSRQTSWGASWWCGSGNAPSDVA